VSAVRALRLVVGITGATGVVYGIRTLEVLKALSTVETHLVITEMGRTTISLETNYSIGDVEKLSVILDEAMGRRSKSRRPETRA